jgi:hypothetical protein
LEEEENGKKANANGYDNTSLKSTFTQVQTKSTEIMSNILDVTTDIFNILDRGINVKILGGPPFPKFKSKSTKSTGRTRIPANVVSAYAMSQEAIEAMNSGDVSFDPNVLASINNGSSNQKAVAKPSDVKRIIRINSNKKKSQPNDEQEGSTIDKPNNHTHITTEQEKNDESNTLRPLGYDQTTAESKPQTSANANNHQTEESTTPSDTNAQLSNINQFMPPVLVNNNKSISSQLVQVPKKSKAMIENDKK